MRWNEKEPTGKELPKLAEKSDGAAADGILREWFLDFQPRGGSKIYELHTGGFAGFLDTLMGVAKLP